MSLLHVEHIGKLNLFIQHIYIYVRKKYFGVTCTIVSNEVVKKFAQPTQLHNIGFCRIAFGLHKVLYELQMLHVDAMCVCLLLYLHAVACMYRHR
jgi:hypothetical protein